MKIALITLFPEMFKSVTDFGISGRAVRNGLLDIVCLTLGILLMIRTAQ